MKRTVIFLSLILVSSYLFAQDVNQVVTDQRGNKKLLGETTKKGLQEAPFNKWFAKNYEDYIENDNAIKALKSELKDFEIKVFFGSWCGDSRRELPRFYKVLEKANYPMNQLEVIAVDSGSEANKQAPNREEKGLNIHRVPTFIFYKDGKEMNRIVEEPVETFERDIIAITSEKRYRPKYNAATLLGNLLNEKPLDSLNNKINELRDQYADYVKHSGELNTLGYVLLSAKLVDKALLVFKLNKAIFPYKPNPIDSYAEALFIKEEYTEALKNYHKVLTMNPNDENAVLMVNKINGLIDKKSQ